MKEKNQLPRQYRILLVEDEPANIQMIAGCLSTDYILAIAKTRKKALELLSTSSFDLMLLDIQLPDGNGFEICQQVVANREKYGNISIIFMTSLDSPDDEARGLSLGGSDYIHKPVNAVVLRARVKLQIQLFRKNELLEHLTCFDGLTEIPNRRAFDDQLEKEWHRARRERKALSLAILDIDYFKQYNDLYGHPAGDQCLRIMAANLTTSFVRNSDFIARYGGEEFAVILYDTDLETAIQLMEKSLAAFIGKNIEHQGSVINACVTFSAGICTATPEADTFNNFLNTADKELYQAKAQGRARICGKYLSGPQEKT
ncbi:diguanylate cyclase [Thalassomonas viridans]|uniref:diguanylate cyclase n=1 Tax=Thalassomonas viridans TaxID=137584 RepID=A0AAE9Z193_9GAMM|nr:diguanylate cyclase [Thalassomonas viridans]WDE03377.1 diguanylate cyclase [Thalassomonas viridans]